MIGANRFFAAAQNDRVTRLEAERGNVDSDVGAALVNHPDDSEWNSYPPYQQTVLRLSLLQHVSNRIFEIRDIHHRVRHVSDPGIVQYHAFGHMFINSVGRGCREVLFVRRQNVLSVLL